LNGYTVKTPHNRQTAKLKETAKQGAQSMHACAGTHDGYAVFSLLQVPHLTACLNVEK
jgi:hypothetical protein